jgi:hypothetical protein
VSQKPPTSRRQLEVSLLHTGGVKVTWRQSHILLCAKVFIGQL